jgi:type III secretory pathway component EscS
MNMNLNLDAIQAMTMSAAAVVPIIVALTQVFKMLDWVQDKYSPFISLLIGIVVTFILADGWRDNLSSIILSGLLFGLAASGLYSGVKASAHAIKQQKNKDNKDKTSTRKDNC